MATLRIFTQYYENYSDTKTPHWKPKGGQTFIIKDIEGDMIMYCDNLTEVCSNLVSTKSNEHEEISVAELTKEIRDQFNKEGNYATNDIPGFEGTLEKLNELTIMCSKELDNEWANESE